MRNVFPTAAIATIIALAAPAEARAADCPDPAAAPAEIERTLDAFFDALRKEDRAAFESLTTGSMYSFDVGTRFDGTELVDVIADAFERGVEIEWSLGAMDTKVRCDVAWTQWENIGSAGIPPNVQPLRWLESAVLVFEDGRWKVDFFHSQRASEE